MLKHLQAVREDSARSPLSAKGQQEGVEFLHWLEAQHFTFLGARDYQLVRDEEGVKSGGCGRIGARHFAR